MLENRYPVPIRSLARAAFYLREGVRVAGKGEPLAGVICYGTNTVGVCAVALAWMLRTRLFAEISGVPDKAFILDTARSRTVSRWKRRIATVLLHTLLRRVDGVHLLFPAQIPEKAAERIPACRVFHGFVPVTRIPASSLDERYVLFLGFPWYLKGVDVLIDAFHEIADSVPDVRLRLVGYFPDAEQLERRAKGHPRISIEKAVKSPEALRLISRCSVLVLPSRTEAMGRVLLEAMAAGKPVVASRVDGIPHYIRHGENGLLFESENVEDLARQLLRVLTDLDLAYRLGRTGMERVRERWTEEHFRREWDALIAAVLASV
jgi:glycosyltransferase involved in cell wall biosynthesis